MPLTAGLRLGPYEIVSSIGAGGMGEVYRALDTRLGRTVAIKILPAGIAANAEMRSRFEREARTISNLNDSNICTLHDIGEQDGIVYLVMEHLEGETLASRLRRGALSDEDTIRYATQIASALHRAHEKGIVHRDLKPANIMLTRSGAKLLDFGLAKLADVSVQAGGDDETRREPLTTEGTVLGTLPYMAPEQLTAEHVDARTDIFAFGAVMYEMVTGRRAFDAPSRIRLMTSILEEQPPPIADLRPLAAPSIDRIVQVALAKKPEDRWQSARDIVLLLQSPAPAAAIGASPLPLPLRRGAMMAALAGLLIGALLTTAVLLRRGSPIAPAAKIRTMLEMPDGVMVTGFGAVALAPDGRSVAYLAEQGDKIRLHVQRLDGSAHEIVPTSERPHFPFWSPDSRYVGFFLMEEEKRIKKFDTVTKSLQNIADTPGIGGSATWGTRGDILFINGPNGGVYRVREEGGKAALLTTLDSPAGEVGHVWPLFLPDGDHFFYLALSSGTGQEFGRNVYVSSVREPHVRTLLMTDGSNVAFIEPHHLLFTRDDRLMVQRFDPKRLELSGQPVPLVPDDIVVNANAGLGEFTVSSNGLLALTTKNVQKTRLVLTDRKGAIERAITDVSLYLHPSISPDGTRVAVARQIPDSRLNGIVLYDIASGAATRLTTEAADYDYPIWSPDGGSVAYGSNRRTLREICVRSVDGSGDEKVLLNLGKEDVPIDWSNNPQHILFRRLDSKTFYDLWALPIKSEGKAFPVITGPRAEHQGQISPDGRWLAYTWAEGETAQLFLTSFPERGAARLVGPGIQPRWRPDGRELFFIAPDLRLTAIPVDNGTVTGPAEPLFQILSKETGPFGRVYDVFPGGQKFLLREALDEDQLHVVLVQGAFDDPAH